MNTTRRLKFTIAAIMILTIGKVNLSCAMERQTIPLEADAFESVPALKERYARLEEYQAETRAKIKEFEAKLNHVIKKRLPISMRAIYDPANVIERAMSKFSTDLQSYLENAWSDDIGAKIKQFQLIALETEQKLSQGTITSNDARNTITQNVKQIDQALSIAICGARPDLMLVQLNHIFLKDANIVNFKSIVYDQFKEAKLYIADLWGANLNDDILHVDLLKDQN